MALTVQGGAYWAYLTVSIDGGPANRLPRDETGATYLVLHDPSSARRLVPLAAGLPLDEHTVRLVATGGWGQWALQGVVVTAATRSSARLGWGLLALALVVTALAGVRFARVSQGRGAGGQAGSGRGLRLASKWASIAVPDAIMWGIALALILIYLASPWALVDLASLALLGLLFLVRPGLAPPLIAASLPFWQRTEPLLRWQFGLFELLTWIGLLAWGARRLVELLTRTAPLRKDAAALASRYRAVAFVA